LILPTASAANVIHSAYLYGDALSVSAASVVF